MLRTIAQWMFTDEKWWDIVGPVCYKYVKAASKTDVKMQNQVGYVFLVLLLFFFTHRC